MRSHFVSEIGRAKDHFLHLGGVLMKSDVQGLVLLSSRDPPRQTGNVDGQR